MERIGRYELKGRLGQGGFGSVHRAYDPVMRRAVAIKLLSAISDPDMLARFRREADTTGNLKHKNIVTVFDFGEHDQQPYLVMELLEGRSLKEVIKSGVKLPLHSAVSIFVEIGEALEYAHARGVIHRDIKPANIMLLPDGSAKVLDFGIARATDQSRQSVIGQIIGTIEYMPPDQVQGAEADHLGDIYSFGLTCYELLSGHQPFRADSLPALFYRIATVVAPPLSELMPACPEELQAILQTAMAKDRAQRYPSMGDLLLDLKRVDQSLKHDRAALAVQEAQDLLRAGADVQAEARLREALTLDPSNTAASDLRRSLRQHRKIDELLVSARGQVQADAFGPALETLEQARRLAEAESGTSRRAVVEALIEHCRAVSNLLQAAWDVARAGDLAGARERARQVLEWEPRSAAAAKLLRQVNLRDGIDRVRAFIAAKQFAEGRDLLAQAMQEYPEEPPLRALSEELEASQARHSEFLRIEEWRWIREQQRAAEEARKKAEEERLLRERREAEAQRLAAEEASKKAEEERLLRERREAEANRLAAEEARKKAEEERLLRERREAEANRLAAEEARKKAEEERLLRERREAEAQRLAAEEARILRERREAEAQRLAVEEARKKAEEERLLRERREAEAQRLAAEEARKKAEEERLLRERREAEAQRLAAEEARKKAEEERLLRERREAEAQRLAAEEAKSKAEEDRLQRLRLEAEEKRRAEAAVLERRRKEDQRLDRARLEAERKRQAAAKSPQTPPRRINRGAIAAGIAAIALAAIFLPRAFHREPAPIASVKPPVEIPTAPAPNPKPQDDAARQKRERDAVDRTKLADARHESEALPKTPQAPQQPIPVPAVSLSPIRQVQPEYPPQARQARIQGTVSLQATIGPNGAVQTLQPVSGNPLLAPAAQDAVRQWIYKPTLVNGQPVSVSTQIDVNFVLPAETPATPAPAIPTPAPPDANPDRAAVLSVLASFAQAIQKKDLPGVKANWPGIPSRELDDWRTAFHNARSIGFTLSPKSPPSIDGAVARVECQNSIRKVFDGDAQAYVTETTVRVSLRKRDGAWVIDSMR
jgi:serine/threonine-protein kinase